MVRTQDPRKLAECLTNLMDRLDASDTNLAAGLADQLDAMVQLNPDLIVRAQLFLERHGCNCD